MTSFTFRDRVKIACLVRCIDAGLDEERMIAAFQAATRRLREGGEKTAGWLGSTAAQLGYLPLLAIPAAGLSAAALGHIAGNTAKNVEVGRLPTTEEIKLLDEIAAYHRTADEIKRRTEDNEREKKENSKPSVRKMF